MIKFFLHNVLGFGKLPSGDRKELEGEGITVIHEGVPFSITYINFRAPGKIFIGKRRWFIGAVAVTGKRIAAYAFSRKLFNIPINDPRLSRLQVSAEGQKVCMKYEASDFAPDSSGRIEIRFTVPGAEQMVEMIKRGTTEQVSPGMPEARQ